MLTAWQKMPGLTERLISLHPSHSTRQIAEILTKEFDVTITRCQVIGKSHRLKLPSRPLPAPKYVRPSRARIVAPPLAPPPIAPPPCPPTPIWNRLRADSLPIVQLKPNECRFLYGDYPFVCCTEPRIEGSSYCIGHHQQAHLPPQDYAQRRA